MVWASRGDTLVSWNADLSTPITEHPVVSQGPENATCFGFESLTALEWGSQAVAAIAGGGINLASDRPGYPFGTRRVALSFR